MTLNKWSELEAAHEEECREVARDLVRCVLSSGTEGEAYFRVLYKLKKLFPIPLKPEHDTIILNKGWVGPCERIDPEKLVKKTGGKIEVPKAGKIWCEDWSKYDTKQSEGETTVEEQADKDAPEEQG